MIERETGLVFFRTANRPFMELTNEELQLLFNFRASKVKLDPKGLWDCDKSVYWGTMIPALHALYEIMLEIQARYPKAELSGSYYEFNDLLPLNEKQWLEHMRVEYGLKELPPEQRRQKKAK